MFWVRLVLIAAAALLMVGPWLFHRHLTMKVISTRLEEVSRPKNRVLRTGLALLVSAVVLLCLPFVWVAFAFTFAALVDVVPGAYYLWFLGYTLASLVLWTVNRCLRGAVEEIRQSVRES